MTQADEMPPEAVGFLRKLRELDPYGRYRLEPTTVSDPGNRWWATLQRYGPPRTMGFDTMAVMSNDPDYPRTEPIAGTEAAGETRARWFYHQFIERELPF